MKTGKRNAEMDIDRKKLRGTSRALLSAAAFVGTSAYASAKLLAKTAMDREAPKVAPRVSEAVGQMIAGSLVDQEIRTQQQEAAQRLREKSLETVVSHAPDGIELVGHWYPCQSPRRVVIAMHGWRSSWDMGFGLIADFLHDEHCCVLFAEQRGQNSSGGDYMGLGVTERFDCLQWVRWVVAEREPDLPIYLSGVSMGATTVLMAAGLDLPNNVHGIVADCGYTSPDEIGRHIANDNLHLPYRLRRKMLASLYEQKNQVRGFDYSTLDALGTNSTPVLFIHGTHDQFVPVDMTYQNYMACTAPKRLLIVPGAGHGLSCLVEPERYKKALQEFWADFD